MLGIGERYRGWAVYRIQPTTGHGLYSVPLLPFPQQSNEISASNLDLRSGIGNPNHHGNREENTLNLSTYKDTMLTSLCIWSEHIRRQLMDKAVDTCYISSRDEDNLYGFHIGGCDSDLSMGDSIFAENHEERVVFIGEVRLVTPETVEAKMPTRFALRRGINYRIRFEHRLLPFQIQQHALLDIIEWGENIIFPPDNVRRLHRHPLVVVESAPADWQWQNSIINNFQREAILKLLEAKYRPLPYLVSGPPGTGKTSTLIEYVNQIYKHLPTAKILICAPSNTAANVILEKLEKSKWINNKKKKSEQEVEPTFIRMLSYTAILRNDTPSRLKRYCGTLPMENVPIDLKVISELDQLKSYRIVISTVNYTGNFMRMGMQGHFSHLIVDEAGQALETETLIPLSLMKARNCHIAMFGDEKQLGPVVMSKLLMRRNFHISMLERLSTLPLYQEESLPMYSRLLKNYRSVPSLLNYYNFLFYQERLIAMVTDSRAPEFRLLDNLDSLFPPGRTRMRYRGLYFMSVLTPSYVNSGSYSLYNPGEVERVVEFYKRLLDKGVPAKDVGIITPYRAQSREIQKAIDDGRLAKPKVGTTEVFQGDQRLIMLMSPVRSFRGDNNESTQNIKLRFVNDPKRINVSISRARALMIIFGNNRVLAGADNWQRLIQMTVDDSTLIL